MGQVIHKEPEDSAEVVLSSSHHHLDGNRRLRVAVAAGGTEKLPPTQGEVEAGGVGGTEDRDLQSLDAGDDGVEGGLDVSGGTGADHREALLLEQV